MNRNTVISVNTVDDAKTPLNKRLDFIFTRLSWDPRTVWILIKY